MKFSLIIPVAPNRDAEILDSIKRLDYSKKDLEIIIEKGKNPSENRNKGIKKAKGDFIVFLDDDAQVKEDYLKKIKEFFNKYSLTDIVGGPQLTLKEESFFGKISGIIFVSNFGAFRVNKRYIQGQINLNADETFLTSANLCVKKSVFKKIDGFDVSLFPGEDPEFIFRAKKFGLKVAYNPEMIIYHKRRGDFPGFCKQIFKYGFTRPKKNKISKKTNLFFLIPMLFSIYFLFLPTLSLASYSLLLPFLLYIVLSIIFALYDSIKNKVFVGLFILPFLYIFTHLSYGLGMLAGYFENSATINFISKLLFKKS